MVNRIAPGVKAVINWLDSSNIGKLPPDRMQRPDMKRWIPYVTLHAGVLGVFFVGWSWIAVAVAVFLYVIRMFAITGFYHRYFSHKTFKTSRLGQFFIGVWGNTAAQRGPIWWAAQHRVHHAHSDTELDHHSPIQHGFYWSHIGWLTVPANLVTDFKRVPDLAKYPELRFLDRFDYLVPIALAVGLFFLGAFLNAVAPGLGTNGLQMLVWGFFISTVVLFHCTAFINSLAHLMGNRRFETKDHSRNSWFLAILTLGEGWHNNHHRYPAAACQGFYWWEIDITYCGLKLMEKLGIIWDVKSVPQRLLDNVKQSQDDDNLAAAA